MDVCVWDVHSNTYLDIWVRRVIIIIVNVAYCDSMSCTGIDSWLSPDYDLWYVYYGPWPLLICTLVLTIAWFASLILYAWIFGGMRQKVYIWGFPCLDYSFDVLVSWDRTLSVYNHFCLHSYLLGFPVSWWLFSTCPSICHTCVLNPILIALPFGCRSYIVICLDSLDLHIQILSLDRSGAILSGPSS